MGLNFTMLSSLLEMEFLEVVWWVGSGLFNCIAIGP
jgi:hypothetical protein